MVQVGTRQFTDLRILPDYFGREATLSSVRNKRIKELKIDLF